jgi:hypothetical protein
LLNASSNFSWHLPALSAPTIVAIFSTYSWWAIRGFLHYQRMREVIFVLETAFTAFHLNFELLNPPFEGLGAGNNNGPKPPSDAAIREEFLRRNVTDIQNGA